MGVQKMGAQSQSAPPIEAQLETLLSNSTYSFHF